MEKKDYKEKYSKKVNKKKNVEKKLVDIKWILTITITAFLISIIFSGLSEIIISNGGNPTTRILSDEEYKQELERKLLEE